MADLTEKKEIKEKIEYLLSDSSALKSAFWKAADIYTERFKGREFPNIRPYERNVSCGM